MSKIAASRLSLRARQRALRRWPRLSPFAIGLCLTLALVVFVANAASAQGWSPLDFTDLDPTQTIVDQAREWVGTAATWGERIYFSLAIIEFIALAVTTLLFRDNLGEFLAGVSLKVFIGGVYFWFISNAGTDAGSWPQQIIGSFRAIGLQFAGLDPGTPVGPGAATFSGAEGITAAGLYVATAFAVQAEAGVLATSATVVGIFGAGVGAADFIMSTANTFSAIIYGMAMMIVMASAAIWLQLVLVTIESYIVMGAGIFFIGFAGSKFTVQFSQGYFSYMFNVGAKYLVIYIVLAIENPLMGKILGFAAVSLGTAIAAAGTPLVFLSLIPATFGLVSVVIAAALVWMIPGLVGSFLNGQSSASGSAVLGQAMGSIAAASNFVAQMHQALKHDKNEVSNLRAEKKAADAAKSAKSEGADTTTSAPNSGAIAFSSLPGAIAADGKTTGIGQDTDAESSHMNEQISQGYALSALAQGVPRDIGQPSAVQVRLANPDRL